MAIEHQRQLPKLSGYFAAALAATVLVGAGAADAESRHARVPEILFLGDSHLSFGAGKVFKRFFKNFEQNCKQDERWMGHARDVSKLSFSLMGVKSTALHTWVARGQSLKRMICVPDPKWPVNARLYGFPHRADGTYVQFGKDKSFPFCRANKSGLEALFAWGKPRLAVFYFMGNTISRWANSPRAARLDVKRLMTQMPDKTACVFMTTSPVYRRRDNAQRIRAQSNIAAAFAEHGDMRCKFVPMLTTKTVAAIQGKPGYFRRHPDGRVKDPYHPLISAARRLTKIQRGPMCRAVLDAMRPQLQAAKN